MATKKKIKVHVAQLIPVDKLRWLEGNSQKQSKQQFAIRSPLESWPQV